jgi:hypothetical protein
LSSVVADYGPVHGTILSARLNRHNSVAKRERTSREIVRSIVASHRDGGDDVSDGHEADVARQLAARFARHTVRHELSKQNEPQFVIVVRPTDGGADVRLLVETTIG